MGINPLRGNIAVAPIFEKDTFEHGTLELIKPDQYKGRSTQGIVKYVGEGVEGIYKGDYVFFSAYTGTLWELEGELLIIFAAKGIKAKRDMKDDDRRVPGLYFKGATDWSEIKESLSNLECLNSDLTYQHLNQSDLDSIIKLCQPSYWPADYSQSIQLLSQSIDDAYELKERNPNDPENFLYDPNS